MAMEERGMVLKRSRASYLYNYFMLALLSVLLIVSWNSLGLTFSLTPQSVDVFWKDVIVLAIVGAMVYFFEQPEMDRMFKYYVITNNDVIFREGVLNVNRVTIPLQSISNVDVCQSVLGRIFNFGDVNVMGFKNTIMMRGVPEPDVVYKIINNKISLITGTKQRIDHERKKHKKKKHKIKEESWRDKEKALRSGRKKRPRMMKLKIIKPKNESDE